MSGEKARRGGRGPSVFPGDRFSRLVVLEEAPRKERGGRVFRCRCDCGNESVVSSSNLRGDQVKSCGCLNREIRIARNEQVAKHGHGGGKRTPTYRSWLSMRSRCNNPNATAYERYGGRGVTVCERWDSFENFLADMGERPEGATLDRIDPDGNYEPGNCRWADWSTQRTNQRRVTRNRCDACGQFLPKDSRYSNRCSNCWGPEDDFV